MSNTPQSANKMLIVVDMLNGFINDGPLADIGIRDIIEENTRLIKEFIKDKSPVIAICDSHTDKSPEFDSFPPHCIDGTWESELIDELKPYEKDMIVLKKNSTNGFFAPGFVECFKTHYDVVQIVIIGCCTDICVMNLAITLKNFFNQINAHIEIIVPKNAVETYDIEGIHEKKEWNEAAFKFMAQAGIKVVEKVIRITE